MLESAGVNFWQVHSILFVIVMCIFPRITMFITGICFMPFTGLLFWLGWLLTPRLTVAILASFFYFTTNPILCVLAWLWALSGESAEKKTFSIRIK